MNDDQDAGCSGVQVSNWLHDVIRDQRRDEVPSWNELSEISLKSAVASDVTDESDSSNNNDEEKDSPEPRSSDTTEPPIRSEREQKSRPCGSTAVDGDDVPDGTGEVVSSAPEIFRLVPGFVIFARLQAPDFFADFVDFFFKKKKWPTFDRIPEEFRVLCDKCGVAAESYEDMPGFAPEWMFHLKIMDYELFWNSIHQFFDKKTFPTWKSLPESITYWFRNLNLREFEYPSHSKFDKLPKVIKKRFNFFMEHRLRLTEKRFAMWG